MRLALALVLLAASHAFAAEAVPQDLKIERLARFAPSGAGSGFIEVVAEQLKVKFSTTTPPAGGRAAALAALGGSILIDDIAHTGWSLVQIPAGMSVAVGLQLASSIQGVEAVSPHHIYRPVRLPNDPLVSQQYGLSQVNAFGAWEFERGETSQVTVAVIDGGIESTHPDLQTKLIGTSQFCAPSGAACVANNPPTAACAHGTNVAGIAAARADNATGVAGMSWGARLISIKVFNPGCASTGDVAIANAIDYATSQQGAIGPIVINLSIGDGSLPTPPCDATVKTALDNAGAAGIPVVIAAGNSGSGVEPPASCADTSNAVIPVGATNESNAIAYFSSTGTQLANHGVVAPGFNTTTTDLSGGYTSGATGTSFSAPHVAGLAALIISAKNGCANLACAQDVRTKIRAGADKLGLSSTVQGAGRINAQKTMRLQSRGTLSDFDGEKKVTTFPNPFRVSDSGTMSFALPPGLQGRNAKIKIFTANGELVRELNGLAWDGKNDGGSKVASGTYLFHVETSAGKTTGRFAVIR